MSNQENYKKKRIDHACFYLFVSAVVVRLLWHIITGYIADDAFITFRYAENIASGVGFVYNSGEQVMGTTTPLFMLILSALAIIGINPLIGSLLISIASSGFTAVIIYRLALLLKFEKYSILPAVVYILFPRLLPTDTGGMETSLFAFLIITSFYYQRRGLVFSSTFMSSLSILVRPEGALLFAILSVHNLFKSPKKTITPIIISIMPVLCWLIFSYVYFGSIIPHSIPAKLALYSQFGTMPFWDSVVFLMAWHNPFGIALFIMAIAGAHWLYHRTRFGLLEMAWMAGIIAFYSLGKTHLFLWYIAPIYPVYIIIASAAIPFACEKIQWLKKHYASIIVIGLTAIVLILANYPTLTSFSNRQETIDRVHKKIGLYLRQNTGKNDIVAAEDIGYIGYYSKCRILDRDGLISPQAVPYNGDARYLQLILDNNPDWVVASPQSEISGFLTDVDFLECYKLKESFISFDKATTYQIYRMK